MGCSFTIRKDAGVLITRFRDRVADDEFVTLYHRLLTDPHYEPGLIELADLRQVSEFAVTTPALRKVDALIRTRLIGSSGCQTLIIAPGNLPYGLARMYAALADGGPEQVHVFRTLEETAETAGLSLNALKRLLDDSGTRPIASAQLPLHLHISS